MEKWFFKILFHLIWYSHTFLTIMWFWLALKGKASVKSFYVEGFAKKNQFQNVMPVTLGFFLFLGRF